MDEAKFDTTKMQTFSEVTKQFAEIFASFPREGGLLGLILGNHDLKNMGQQLTDFTESIVKVAETANSEKAIKYLTEETANRVAKFADIMSAFANNSPKWGLLQELVGETRLDKFGEQLVEFAPNIVDFASTVSTEEAKQNLTEGVANRVKAFADILSEMAKNTPKYSVLQEWITGETDMSKFGGQLEDFGENVVTFAGTVKDLDPSSVTASMAAIQSILDLKMPAVRTSFNGIGYEQDALTLVQFAGQLKDAAPNFKTFSEDMASVDATVMSNSARAIGDLGDAARHLVDVGSDDTYFSTFSNGIILIGAAIADYGAKTSAFGDYGAAIAAACSGAITAISAACASINEGAVIATSSLIEAMSTLSTDSISAFTNGLNNANQTVTDAVTHFIGYARTALRGNTAVLIKDVDNLISSITTSTTSSINGQESAIINAINLLVSGIRAKRDAFYSAGVYLSEGFANGMVSMLPKVRDKADELGKAAIDALREKLDEHSPSKKALEIGSFFGEGFVNGITSWLQNVKDKASELGGQALSALNGSFKNSMFLADMGIDFNPVITPTLDLSRVTQEAQNVGSLFDSVKIGAGIPEIQNEYENATGTTFNFYQTNNSPKALSATDIYRQTKNQFSTFKRTVGV